MKYYFFLSFFGIAFSGNAQISSDSLFDQAELFIKAEKYDSAYFPLVKSIELYHQDKEWEKANRSLSYITRLPYYSVVADDFIKFVEKQSDYLKEISPIESAYIHSHLGNWKARNGKYSEALEKFKFSADHLYELSDTQYLHYVYYWLGQTYQYGRSNGAECLVYANQAERIFNLKKNQDSIFIGKIYKLKGLSYQYSDEKKAIENFKKVQLIFGDANGAIESLISKSLANDGLYEEAFLSAVKASKKYFAVNNEINGEYLANEAMILCYLEQFEPALEKINLALNIIGKIYAPTEPNFIKLYYFKAQILKGAEKFDEALDNCQKVFTSFYPSYVPKSNTAIPNINGVTPSPWVLDALKEFGEILTKKYNATKDSKYLKYALNAHKICINDIEIRRNLMENWDSKEQYNQYLYEVYQDALIASALLYQAEASPENKSQVFYFLDKSKSTLLQEITDEKRKRKNIPPEILEQENEFLISITNTETLILQAESKEDFSTATDLKNELFDIRQSLAEFKDKHSSHYSFTPSDDTSEEAAKKVTLLPNGVAILAYHTSKDQVLSIAFNNEELYINLESKTEAFDKNILQMRSTLSDWKNTLSNRSSSNDTINTCAENLSSLLLKPLDKLSNAPNQIIIMPNGLLNNIPFEILPIPGGDESMISKYDISYAYLFSSFPDSTSNDKSSASFAGFAPSYTKDSEDIKEDSLEQNPDDSKWLALRSGLIDIPEARKSVSKLADRYSASSWISNEATKENFINEAANYDVLHLGMHSLLNEQTSSLSSLVFSGNDDNELYLREVQSMDIPASLVVLSACNTGVGRNVVGEGSFSLARAFFYAGAQSTLMSLWQVPDAQTSRIMELFYSNLELGLNKSQALAKSKRDYLTTASVLESHPAFWSGFVLVGDTSTLVLEPKSFFANNSIYLLGFLFLGLLLFFMLKKKSS